MKEIEENSNIHGYIKGDFIILHSQKQIHYDPATNHSTYGPCEFAINPECIKCMQSYSELENTKSENTIKTKIYFIPDGSESIYENLHEIIELINEFKNIKK